MNKNNEIYKIAKEIGLEETKENSGIFSFSGLFFWDQSIDLNECDISEIASNIYRKGYEDGGNRTKEVIKEKLCL
jgi:hypothetical protein